MFFTGEVSNPFRNIYDVFEDSSWSVIFQDGIDINFSSRTKNDPAFAEYWSRVSRNRDFYTFLTIERGLQRSRHEHVVLFAMSLQIINSYLKSNPQGGGSNSIDPNCPHLPRIIHRSSSEMSRLSSQ